MDKYVQLSWKDYLLSFFGFVILLSLIYLGFAGHDEFDVDMEYTWVNTSGACFNLCLDSVDFPFTDVAYFSISSTGSCFCSYSLVDVDWWVFESG